MSYRALIGMTGAWIALLAAAPPALAHDRAGRAQPVLQARLSGPSDAPTLAVSIRDRDGGEPLSGALVQAGPRMRTPHVMELVPITLTESRPGNYTGRLRILMPGDWQVIVRASGASMSPAEVVLDLTRSGRRQATNAGSGASAPAVEIRDELSRSDLIAMAVLWLHGLSALGWIAGVVLMALALSARPRLLQPRVHEALNRAYRRWGAWLHWSFAALVVATGVYNMLRVTPFSLVWRPDELEQLAAIPYGALYEAILIVKLGLFAALLVTGTRVLVRTVRSSDGVSPGAGGVVGAVESALGPAGVVYLACVPLILIAAVALRYVHILSHVGEVVGAS